ncbi:hypothetical protein [Rhizobium binae]|uniref:hypothetical protein n=1 Tax=Rhizobium binae TaxID=1138190 RepID=UPI001C8363BB|nr:hypothetical protein [Rhizobium binae]MBX4944634.1 hypothetical protein [Rhizobium binae]MBX4980665.1 hypothetical protein [Rhizobium binae]
MATRIISGPEPIITPADIAGDHAPDDAGIARMIAAVQASIAAPSGWLGRALGKVTLELWLTNFDCRDWISLYAPVVAADAISVKYLDLDEVEQTVDPGMYWLAGNDLGFRYAFQFPQVACRPDAIRIRYSAGYEADAVPVEAKQATIMSVQHMAAISAENLFLRSEEVEGVGSFQYTVSDQAGEIIRKASENLLQGLRVYA